MSAWYKAMEDLVPCYASRCQGDAESWRKVLVQQGFGNDCGYERLLDEAKEERGASEGAWEKYQSTRPWLAPTPRDEAAARLLRLKGPILADAIRNGGAGCDGADEAMRSVISALAGDGEQPMTTGGKRLHAFLCNRICVPRDLGVLPARALRDVTQ